MSRQKPGFCLMTIGHFAFSLRLLIELCHNSDFDRVFLTSFFLSQLFLTRLLNSKSTFYNLERIRYSSSTSFYINIWRASRSAAYLGRWTCVNTTLMSVQVFLIISSRLMSYSRAPWCTIFLKTSLVCGLCCEMSKELSLNVNS